MNILITGACGFIGSHLVEKLVKENLGNGNGHNFGLMGTPTSKYKDLYEDDDVEGDDKEEKKTLKARLVAIQEVTAMVQNALGHVASLAESSKNTFNYSVPFLSWLAIIILVAVTLVLYFISLRFLVIGKNTRCTKMTLEYLHFPTFL